MSTSDSTDKSSGRPALGLAGSRRGLGIWRTLGVVVLKLSTLAVVVYALTFYLRLGYFLPVVYGVGVALAVVATASQWRGARSATGAAVTVAVAYLLIQFAVSAALTTESQVEFQMSWGVQPGGEIVLGFDDFPGNFLGLYSDEVADYLAATGDARVGVELSVTRDLGCFRGFSQTRIGGLTSWSTSNPGYVSASGAARSPFTDPWWCPA